MSAQITDKMTSTQIIAILTPSLNLLTRSSSELGIEKINCVFGGMKHVKVYTLDC